MLYDPRHDKPKTPLTAPQRKLIDQLSRTLTIIEHGHCKGALHERLNDYQHLHCLVGAVDAAVATRRGPVTDALYDALPEHPRRSPRTRQQKRAALIEWNDREITSPTNVMDLIRRAREAAGGSFL